MIDSKKVKQLAYQTRIALDSDAKEIVSVHMKSRNTAFIEISESILLTDREDLLRKWHQRILSKYYLINVACVDGSICGFIAIQFLSDPVISHLYIDPCHWRKKLGTRLLEEGFSQMQTMGYKKVSLWAMENSFAEIFYRKIGFTFSGDKKVVPESQDQSIMQKKYEKVLTGAQIQLE